MGWTKEEWQMIRDGMSWGDVWALRNPQSFLVGARKMVEEMLIKQILAKGHDANALLLEPQSTFNKGLIGFCVESNRLIYGYHLIVESVANNDFSDEGISAEEALDSAVEWVEYNTMGTSCEGYPIIKRLESKEEELRFRDDQSE